MRIDMNPLPYGEIQYLPRHRCPICGAPGEPYEPLGPRLPGRPEWIGPWRYYGEELAAVLKGWEAQVGFVLFACRCAQHSGRSLRVAHIGAAILPLTFVDDWNFPLKGLAGGLTSRQIARLNQQIIAGALQHLLTHAKPQSLEGIDPLRQILYALACGAEAPEHAYQCIQSWLARPDGTALPVRRPTPPPA